MNYPKITIVTPNYNQVKFIESTIQSIFSQKYPNLEYIIMDGGSVDGSVDIIKKYADKLHFWISEKDNGMYDAIQKGFEHGTGEIMTYINSDDILQPYSLFTAASVFSKYPEVKWINGIPNILDEYNRIVLVGTLPYWNKFHFLTGQYKYIQQEGTFWKKELWLQSGGSFAKELTLAGDMELWSRFFKFEKLYYLPVLLGSFRRRTSGQKSLEQLDEYHAEADSVIDTYLPSNQYESSILNKYNSLLWKIARKINKRKVYFLFGFKELYYLFISPMPQFQFERDTQDFIKISNKVI